MKRDCGFDNLKCILIFCVVFGHFLEFCYGFSWLYRLIYLFHMPVFMFVTGYFAKSGWKSIINKLWMYVLFQVLYLVFEGILLGYKVSIVFNSPYWILWYMFVSVFYTALIPLYRAKSVKKRLLVIGIAVTLSVAAGFFECIDYKYSLSRFFVFQPYFLLGFYAKEQKLQPMGNKLFMGFGIGSLLTVGVLFIPFMSNGALYGSVGYKTAWDALLRVILLMVAVVWIGGFWGLKDRMKKPIPIVTEIGKNTLSVYLIHGFFMRLCSWKFVKVPQNIWIVLVLALTMCVVLGNPFVGKAVGFLSPVAWIKKKS